MKIPFFTWLIAANCLFLSQECTCARILFFHGVSSYSHRVQTYPIAVALAERGHEVSYIAPYHPKDAHPNISELVPRQMAEYVDEFLNDEFDIRLRINNEMDRMVNVIWEFAYDACKSLLESSEFKDWLIENQHKKFDLFILDNCMAECGIAIAHKFGAKHILFDTVSTLAHEYDAIGFLPESSSIPELENNPLVPPFGFFERIANTLSTLEWRIRHYFYAWQIDKLLREALNLPRMPFIDDLQRNASLIFYTGDVITDYPKSLPPIYVNVAGTHCKESTKALPKEMEQFISQNITGVPNHGFVYISLGSLVKSSNLPDNIKQTFFNVIKSFPKLKFLWKWNGDFPSEIPENVLLAKWFPQIDVLGHPKIQAFITQSGRPSTLEALYLGVPMISFPIIGDQDLNADRMAEMGATIKLEIGTVTFDELHDAIQRVVYDPSVKTKVTKLQTLFRDRPMTPVETAVWWSEYVLRTESTAHLRPLGSEQYWFVRRQVDVWAFLSISMFLIVVGAMWSIRQLLRNIKHKALSVKVKNE